MGMFYKVPIFVHTRYRRTSISMYHLYYCLVLMVMYPSIYMGLMLIKFIKIIILFQRM